jgi:uncharacterized damage-inducible protein DinB
MKESKQISLLFQDLYSGNPWIDVSIIGTLNDITAEQAAKKIAPNFNSIWEIVNHLINWRLNVLKRVNGEIIETPPNNYIVPIKEISDSAWKETLNRLEDSQKKWIIYLKNFDEKNFQKIYLQNNLSYYEHIHGIIQHDAYHLGQIVLLKKYIKK